MRRRGARRKGRTVKYRLETESEVAKERTVRRREEGTT